jgi:hypothetical protein
MTTFDVPGAGTGAGQGTQVADISAAGAIAGSYIDGSGVSRGYLRAHDGTITTFDAPGAGSGPGQGTFPGNNGPGGVPGWYIDANGVMHGFLWTPRAADGFVSGHH